MALLTGRFWASRRDSHKLLPLVLGEKARLSLGTVSDHEDRTSQALKVIYSGLRAEFAADSLLNVDETTLFEENKQRTLWTAVGSSIKATVFKIAGRTRGALEDLLATSKAYMGCDHYGAYTHLGDRRLSSAWA